MSKLAIMDNVSRTFHKVGFKFKKHSPEILVVTGVIGTVASAVLACKATTKANLVMADTKKKVEYINEGVEKGEVVGILENGEEGVVSYSVEDGKNDLKIVYAQTGLQLVKLYAPSVILGALSITSILAGHNILRKRYAASAMAYAMLDQSFKDYRSRVVDRFGEELDRELKYNIKKQEVEETVTNEDGTETVVKKTVDVADFNRGSEYAIIFDETCKGWCRDAGKNKYFLLQVQNWANEQLKRKGYLFLNDVYEMLGVMKTEVGFVVGWLYDKNSDKYDNQVDFFLFDIHDSQKRNFINGREKSVIVDFNVDGNILKMMDIGKINLQNGF